MIRSKIIISIFIVCILFVFSSAGTDLNFTSGNGTAENPFVISSAQDLQNLSFLTNAGIGEYCSKNYSLNCDINLSSLNWIPIGNSSGKFRGNFDGKGYRIYDLNILTLQKNQGLFGYADGAEIKNLFVSGNITTSKNYCGFICGRIDNGTVKNCMAEGTINSTNNNAGGLVGQSEKTDIIDSCFIGFVSGQNFVGGIVGQSKSNITNCYVAGIVNGSDNVGGIIGYSSGSNKKIGNCISLLSEILSVSCPNIGRLSGFNSSNYQLINNFAFDEMSTDIASLTIRDGVNISKNIIWKNKSYFENTMHFDFENDWKMNEGDINFALPVPKCLKGIYSGNAVYLAPVYNISIADSIGGGISTDKSSAVVDETVSLTNSPESGYQFSKYIIKSDSEEFTTVLNSFVMPKGSVNISAEFTQIPIQTPTQIPTQTPTANATSTPKPVKKEEESVDTGSGNYQYYPRHVSDGGKIDFGTSPCVTSLELPYGKKGNVLLNTKPETEIPDTDVYLVFEITAPELYDDENAYIYFKIPLKETEKPDCEIILCRVIDGETKPLETVLEKTHKSTAYFKAETDGFGIFSIIFSEKKPEETNPSTQAVEKVIFNEIPPMHFRLWYPPR